MWQFRAILPTALALAGIVWARPLIDVQAVVLTPQEDAVLSIPLHTPTGKEMAVRLLARDRLSTATREMSPRQLYTAHSLTARASSSGEASGSGKGSNKTHGPKPLKEYVSQTPEYRRNYRQEHRNTWASETPEYKKNYRQEHKKDHPSSKPEYRRNQYAQKEHKRYPSSDPAHRRALRKLKKEKSMAAATTLPPTAVKTTLAPTQTYNPMTNPTFSQPGRPPLAPGTSRPHVPSAWESGTSGPPSPKRSRSPSPGLSSFLDLLTSASPSRSAERSRSPSPAPFSPSGFLNWSP